ncbi:MAG: phosphotransferase [Firmicutes bacterium]|nr:phosphotransferase [Bacillota bacterium]
MIEKISENNIKIFGRIDSNNAKEFEDKLLASFTVGEEANIDASELEYVSSAGLRVFLKLKKVIGAQVNIREVSKEVYDIFDVTGFTSIINISKKLRNISVEGMEVIGEGANGKVYRMDDENVIKVFAPSVPIETVQQERDFARAAFVAGVPTAIAYDVVKCGESYAAVYELLKARTLSTVIREEPERAEEFGTRMGELLKLLHSTQADTSIMENMLDVYKKRAESMRKYLTDAETEKLKSVYEALAETTTMLHGDFHVNNVMLMGDELIFIDMSDVGYGHPLLDWGSTFLPMVHIGRRNPASVERYLGINYELTQKVWNNMVKTYFGKENAEKGEKLAEIYGFAKYMLVPFIYTKFDENMIEPMKANWRKTGLIAPEFDVSLALEK